MFSLIETALTYIIPFLLVLTVVVTIHELGHYWAARACGVAIDQFSIGFGRRIFGWRDRQGVEWRIGWIPLGGYVKFSGDENAASVPDHENLEAMRQRIDAEQGPGSSSRYFHFKPVEQRAFITAAGPLANFVLAIVLFAFLLMSVGETVIPARVAAVQPDSPAARAGFIVDDMVVRANGQKIDNFFDLQQIIAVRSNAPTAFVVDRGGQLVSLTATPERRLVSDRMGGEQKIGVLGIASPAQMGERTVRRYGPLEAVAGGVERTWRVLSTTVYYLGRVVTGRESADQLGGPLRIAQASGQVAQSGAQGAPDTASMLLGSGVALLGLTAVLSVGIGFMNLLPVPVLDGGHLVFYAYEAIARRPLAAKVQAAGYRVGLALLLGLMLFATWNDLQQLRVFKFLGGLIS
ncbi:RIP metalloprotease [Phenylobacterium sp.]|uniref:M50 family metallopeptidase n=1 Tax=Phenylobacterium sp. TaxID=1871053 RepID=UPI00273203AB|nr:M50 family metallopeptidase [Phenylobacterium sp.]MDP1874752.1 M50 family metallopeptidase [Phenylobacterium sp.]MDP3299855.1 M50 family metallopeptidase [Phenylobacterium sp.]MDP3490096.1 M50 family metallopeptidase [Phenylobacterium sp.]